MYDYKKHLLTAKHNMERMEQQQKSSKVVKVVKKFTCDCGKSYKVSSGLWKHKKICALITNSIVIQEKPEEKPEEKPSVMEIITQNKEIMNLLVLQNEELKRQNKEQSDTIRELIPKIGNNNNNITTTTNNQFNLQTFLNEDCKDALNFSDFIETIKVSFEDIENQVASGYVKGISKLFIENLQGLGTNNRPIHCTDKKRKTIYIKENNVWDKEGSQDTLKKGIQEITRRTMKTLIDEKETNSEEYADMDSEFSMKCIDIQRNLFPTAPRETSFCKIASNISDNTIIVDNQKTIL
jgi:hypothetical protein